MKNYVQLSTTTILVLVAMVGVGITGHSVIVNAQQEDPVIANGTVVIPPNGTIDVYDKSFESYVGLAIAIISLIATYLVKTNANKKYVDGLYQAKDIAEMIRQDRETRREGMQVVYEMLPEKAQEIVDRPKVRLQELDKDVGAATQKVNSLENIIEKFGKPKI
jgi:low affinity Fe/Cu permease